MRRSVGLASGALFLACASLFLTACATGEQASTSASGSTPTETTAGLSKAKAKRLTRSMLLRLSDLPAGWRAQASEEDETTCAGIEDLTDRYDVVAQADSKDFVQGPARVSSGAGIFAQEKAAEDALDYLQTSIESKAFHKCLDDSIRKEATEGVIFGKSHVREVSFPALGDGSSAWEIIVPFAAKGKYANVFVDAVAIRRGSALAMLFFSDVPSPYDAKRRRHLARLVETRMNRAVARMD